MASPAFLAEMERKRGSNPRTKIEFIDKANNVTDISRYYLAGASLEQIKERAPDEIQAGEFDIVLSNHDDTFSEFKTGTLLYGLDYHGAKIKIYEGFLLPDGTEEYESQGVGYIDILVTDPTNSRVTFRCRDILWRIMDQKIHARLDVEVPVANPSNVGDGMVAGISKLPFVTVNETWTLTCTTPGGDGVGLFSVVGSVSGSIGPATSGTEFVSSTFGIRFIIRAGATNWAAGDIFTFESRKHPEWDTVNAGKIIWSILTGYDWDTNTQEDFADYVFDFDNTQSSANTEIDYESFETVVAIIDTLGVFDIKGFATYDTDAIAFLQSLLTLFLGSLYTGNDGRLQFETYIPTPTPNFKTFGDDLKITALSYERSVDEVINHVSVNYVASDVWPWSNESLTLDGHYVDFDATSVTDRKQLSKSFDLPWFSVSGNHVQDFASKLISRYKDPPVNVEFTTGLDALLTQIGDRINVNDEKSGFVDFGGEVTKVAKQFDRTPASILIRMRQDATTNLVFGAIGSEEDEGDGISPQDDDYDTSSTSDKQFAYFSANGNASPPQYFIF